MLTVDKIQCYNDMTHCEEKVEDLDNFLTGLLNYFKNYEFIYTFIKAITKKYEKVTILPSFKHNCETNINQSGMKQLVFKIEGQDNSAVCKMLNRKIQRIKNKHGNAVCVFVYNKKKDCITLEIKEINLV